VKEVLRHYRRFEWNPDDAKGAFVHADFARHAVRSFRSPQLLLANTIPYKSWFDTVLGVEFQRHRVHSATARTLMQALKNNNSVSYDLQLPKLPNVVALSCRDTVSAMYGLGRVTGDFTNGSSAVTISRPAFDEGGTTALVLAVNDVGSHRGNLEELEFILLHASGNDQWKLSWHTSAGGAYQPRSERAATAATDDDHRVFDAVLARLAKGRFDKHRCVGVVNQTRTDTMPSSDIASAATAAERVRTERS
jgi:hypothetical protein